METTQEPTTYEQERDKPLPSRNHGFIQAILTGELLRYREQYTAFSELTLQIGDLRVTPDLCVYPKMSMNFQKDEVRMTEPPLLAIEILSPTQSQQDVVNRINNMLDAGVQSCWLVQPATESITIFVDEQKPTTVSTGPLRDPATDIEVNLDDIFDEG
ncbi:MAG: Uma2 family endonuclease [Salinibacter sp.]